jgi:membrane-bound lytic murein transglycosylase D
MLIDYFILTNNVLYRHIKEIVFFIFFTIPIYAVNIENKYPSYQYVFSEFDIDYSYVDNQNFVHFVVTHEKKLKKFYEDMQAKGKDILPLMRQLLFENGMSDLLTYLSMIESGLSSDAVSSKKAVGLWQFMPKTAQHYHLIVGNGYDERYDNISATKAAIKYLKKLYKEFHKWYLAVMAYNCGEGCVEKAIQRAETDDLAILLDEKAKYLPSETRIYIKKILLLALIGENSIFGVVEEKNPFIQVEVKGGEQLIDIAKSIDMNLKDLLKLNRGIRGGVIPKEKFKYTITIPLEKIYAFYLRYDVEYVEKKDKNYMITYSVKLGDTLESIAKQYDVSVDEIMTMNHLKDESLILDKLLILPVNKEKFENISKNKREDNE